MALRYEQLSREQRRAIEKIERARSEEKQAGLSLATAQAAVHRAVFDALNDGVPATEIATTLKVTRSRVYQMRDTVLRHMQRSSGAGP